MDTQIQLEKSRDEAKNSVANDRYVPTSTCN